jgi:Domain of Unknown Function (DUF1080)
VLRLLYYLFGYGALTAALALGLNRASAEEVLPPAEATEQWTPVPPVVEAAPGAPPSDAIVLFDGHTLDAWAPVTPGAPGWKIEEGAMVVVPQSKPMDQQTKQSFGDIQLHLEFRTPREVKGKSQERGNSGIYFMGLYELQILDSWKNETYANGQVGAVYKQHSPLANPSRPPGEWQVYDAVFIAPRFSEEGALLSPARITAFLNGVLVQYDAILRGPTVFRGAPKYRPHASKLPLLLQDHRNPVAFRTIWVRELTLPSR